MGTRDLFDKGTPYKILKSSDLQKVTEKVESGRNVRAKVEERERFIPRIDYSDPNNFVRFGSAEKYYEDAFDRITDTFPYDGSEAEITEYFNSSSYFDLYIFEKQYPRTTGYVTLGHGTYTQASVVNGWGTPSSAEYIVTKGGPHTASGGMAAGSLGTQFAGANYYDTDIYNTDREYQGLRYGTRASNLRFHLETGVSVEFWIKKNGWDTSLTEKETVFDLWNGEASSSAGYGRLLVYLTASGHGDEGKYPFRVHMASGSSVWDMQFGESITTSSLDGNWNHVGFSFQSSSADAELKAKFFHSGAYIESTASSDMTFGEVTGSLQSFIGGLRTTPSGNAYDSLSMEGSARLSASLDEFRYWKDYRTAEDIGLNFFRQVRGGSNSDVSNAGLGVYYKFNEGATGTDSLDSIVLDYSGRISNGNWVNYPGSLARNTGSAMVSASALAAEFEDPIIRPEYPTLKTRRSDFIQSGSVFDYTNNSTLYNRIPAWIVDEDPGTLKQMLQIVGSYADSLHLQLEEFPRLKDATYASSSNKTIPIANRLVANYGMQAPEIFADASILAEFMSRDEKRNFNLDLGEVKNRIYKNIYNNLIYIYKSKGTLKSFRNLIRCFGVGDEVVRLNLYGNNATYKVRDNYDPVVSRKNYANFNHPDSFSGVVTQQSRSSNPHASNVTFVSGTVGPYIPTTAEIDVIFPKKVGDRGSLSWFSTSFLSSSIFGTHRLKTAGDETCYVQAATADDYSWSLYAVRPDLESSDAYLVFKSNQGATPEFYLTTSAYPNLYDNQRWNFAVRTRNVKYPVADGASGSTAGSATDYDIDDTYLKLELYGVNYESGLLKNEFLLTSSALTASAYLTADHRYYVGAARTNWTGSVVEQSDVRASSLRHWESYLENEAIRAHAKDPRNFGSLRPYRSTFLLQTALTGTWVPEMETLALHWDFDNVTGSDSSGEFLVDDFSSGSTGRFDRYHDNENNPQFARTIGYQYPGQAYNMRTSSTGAVDRAYIDSLRQNAPETLSSQDTISILSRQDDIEFTRDTRPINYYFSFEKSMYGTITQEIMNFFGTVVEFNNLIGDPKNRYRQDYKELEKLRELFFERVGNTPDLDKYIEYYKWIDNSLSVMLQQLVPATADFSDGIRTMVESHALERNKYWNKFPTLEMKVTDPEAAVHGITELKYDWKYGHAPINDNENTNCLWWQDRAERTNIKFDDFAGSAIDSDREKYREVIETYRTGSPGPTLAKSTRTLPTTTYQGSAFALRRFDEIYNFNVDEEKSVKSGPSFTQRKRFGFTRGALSPFASDSLAMIGSIESEKSCNDALVPPEIDKKEVSSKYLFQSGDAGLRGDDYTAEGIGEIYAPFSLYSSSVTTGYQADVPDGAGTMQHIGSVGLDNYHHDVYGGDMEVPMQGPFTEKYVGGNQYRHIGLVADPTLTSSATRPEAWNLGITAGGVLTLQSRRMTTTYANSRRPEASLLRDEVAKRPVNIRNIQMTASDVGAYKTTLPAGTSTDIGPAQTEFISGSLRSNIGNFEHFYDIVQTSGRDINNVYFVDNEGVSSTAIPSTYVTGIVDYARPDRGKHDWVFVERFSAPGGPETAGDANGGYCLDLESGQYSPYNALPYRNLTVRTPLERILLVNHANQFGFFSNVQDRGGSGASTVNAANYSGTGSYQKVNRNTLKRPELSGTTTWGPLAGLPSGDAVTLTASVYDNGYVTHEIPQMELSYAWITASYTGSLSYGHGSPDGLLSTSAGIVSSINFVSSSDFVSYNDSGVRDYGGDYINLAAAADSSVPQTRHLNTNIVEPMTASEAILGHQIVTSSAGSTTPVGYYVNYGDIDTAPDTTTITDSFIQQVNVGVQPVTASVLHDVLIHRDGYYGYPSWKQTRTAEHQLVRYYRKNNTITINHTPGIMRYYTGAPTAASVPGTLMTFGSLLIPPVVDRFGPLQTFTEPPVDKSSKPLQFVLGIQSQVGIETDGTPRMEVKQVVVDASYGNETVRFSNRVLEELVSVNPNTIYTAYDRIKEAYLNGALNDPTTPVKEFVSLRYGQVVYPASYNAGMEMIRERQNFKVKFWDTTRAKRTTLGFEKSSSMGAPYNGRFNQLTQSAWALDASQIFSDGVICTASNASSSAGGELQNDYLMVHNGAKQFITASALYARKHMLFATMSTTCITLDNPQTGSVTNTVDPSRRQGDVQIYSGDALWEANRLAGTIKTTIENSVDEAGNTITTAVTSFVSGVREPIDPDYESNMKDAILKSQEYSIIPEFRISEHIDKYLKNGVGDWLADNPRMFEIFGASGTLPQNSSGSDFYKIFSNSDFMRRFETIYTDHVGFKSPAKITLRCKAIKKFLPYDGFYPAQRTLDLASQFSQSYARFVNVKGGIDFASPVTDGVTYPKAALRPFLQPFYSPGIMYNTIKSGVAVDYGMYSGSYEVVNNSGSGGAAEIFMIGRPTSIDGGGRGPGGVASGFDNRVPFEALVSPADYISNMTFVDMEPHPSASMNMTASWDGSGDPLYEMMINNFLAESVNMFLPNGQMSTIISAKENDFKNFQPNKVYAMRIRLRKSYNQERTYEASSGKTTYPIPQVTPEEKANGLRETFTMYSRPTAFGPPLAGRDFATVLTAVPKMDSLQGYNPAYTPPYYDGEAWCDILFKASYPRHTLDEILSDAKILSMRVDGSEWTKAGNGVQDATKPYNSSNVDQYAMQITASINVSGKAKVNSVQYRPDGSPVMVVDDPASTQNVWVIQPKFETPMLNFTSTSGSLRPITEAQGNLTMPANGKTTVPRGMWHQFGLPPDVDDKGIFMEISDIGSDWVRNKVPTFAGGLATDYYQTELLTQGKSYLSLADQMKFNKTGIKLGQIAESFEVSEAIVAIPFIEDGGVRTFFEIPKVTVEAYRLNEKDPDRASMIELPVTTDPALVVGESIKNQLDLMKKYVIPPKFNFMEFDSVDPIAMYIFEFKHTFDRDDLTYMWQNLPPKAASKIEISESTISHPLLTNELMGATGRATGRALQSEVKWMVFKVKQRANWNYYSKVLSRVGGDTDFSFNFKMGGADTEVSNVKYSYNWPYDFFSLVEFANIEAQVDIEDTPPVLNSDFLPEE